MSGEVFTKVIVNNMASSESLLKATYESFADRMLVLADIAGNPYRLAVNAGLSQTGIRNYYQGGEPTRPVLIALARVTGVNIQWLVTGDGPMRPTPTEVRTAVVDTFLRYCQNSAVDDTPEVRVEFVKAYNNGVVARAPQLGMLSVYELN